ncbi:MAG: glycosyltransferase family 4 protein, partial [Candidatus Zixiibacteriota bacterium]
LVHRNIESELLFRRSKNAPNPLSSAYLAHQGRKLRRFEQQACENFDYHTTVSEHDKKTLESIHCDIRVQVVPNGVDADYFVPGSESVTANSLIFVGGMSWYPNLDAMNYFTSDIWHLIKSKIPDLTMAMIGRNPPRNITEFAKKETGFKCLGFVEDVRSHISGAAVYVVPLRIGGGTRLKILDAMAMGKAIVSTTIGCEGIDVTHGTDIIIADSAEDIASRTVELLSNRQMREEIGRNARQKALDLYSWKKVYPKLDHTYSELSEMRSPK